MSCLSLRGCVTSTIAQVCRPLYFYQLFYYNPCFKVATNLFRAAILCFLYPVCCLLMLPADFFFGPQLVLQVKLEENEQREC